MALAERRLVELDGMIRPSEDLALYRAEMAALAGPGAAPGWRRTWSRGSRRTTRAAGTSWRPRADGPAALARPPDTCVAPWRSSGWNDHRNVAADARRMMAARGEVAVAGRRGRDRLWDLADRVFPHDDACPARGRRAPPTRTAARRARHRPLSGGGRRRRTRGRRRRSGRLAGRPDAARRRLRGPHRAAVTPGPAGLRPQAHGRAVRFDYQLEMYKPAAPHGAGATGRCPSCTTTGWSARSTRPPTARRESSGVDAVHEDVAFTATMTSGGPPRDRGPRTVARPHPARRRRIERAHAHRRRPPARSRLRMTSLRLGTTTLPSAVTRTRRTRCPPLSARRSSTPTSRPPTSTTRCGPTSCTAASPASSRTCSRTGTTAPSSRGTIASQSSRTTGYVPSSSSTSAAGCGRSSTWRPDASSCMRTRPSSPPTSRCARPGSPGGVEWNIGIRGHTPLTCSPVFAATRRRARAACRSCGCGSTSGSARSSTRSTAGCPTDRPRSSSRSESSTRTTTPCRCTGGPTSRCPKSRTSGCSHPATRRGGSTRRRPSAGWTCRSSTVETVTYPAAAPGAADYFVHLDDRTSAVGRGGRRVRVRPRPVVDARAARPQALRLGRRHRWTALAGVALTARRAVPRDPGRAAADPAGARPDAGAGRVVLGGDLRCRADRPGRRPRGGLVRCPRRDRAVAERVGERLLAGRPSWRRRRGWPSSRRPSCSTSGRAGVRSSGSTGAAAGSIGRRHRSRWRASDPSRRRGSTCSRPGGCRRPTPPCHRSSYLVAPAGPIGWRARRQTTG